MLKRFCLFLIFLSSITLPAKAATPFSATQSFLSFWAFWYAAPFSKAAPVSLETVSEAPEIAADMEIAFSTERVGEGALLKWDLPQPADVSNLIIEGSEDGSHFIDLESLENVEAGVLDVFYDATPKDRRYYRLVANYKDGKQAVTPINALTPVNDFSAVVTPENETVFVVTGNERVELYDMQGQLITAATALEGKCELELQGLPRGPYLVRSGAGREVIFY